MSALPSGTSTYIPSFEASGKLQVEYTRNPRAFALPRIAQMVTSPKTSGWWLKIDASDAKRIETINRFTWADGNDAPQDNAEGFTFTQFTCIRHAFPFRIGQQAVDNADFDVVASHARIKAQKAMTGRCVRSYGVLTTSGNWPAGNTGTATSVGGGVWGSATAANPYIQRAINAMVKQVLAATNGAVHPQDLVLVLDSVGADLMGRSPEIKQYLVNHMDARKAMEYDPILQMYGVPPKYAGVDIAVETAVVNTAVRGATDATVGFLSGLGGGLNAAAVLLWRPGFSNDGNPSRGMEGPQMTVNRNGEAVAAPFASTLTIFENENMTVETKYDSDNRRTMGRVVDTYVPVLTAGEAGFFLTNIDS